MAKYNLETIVSRAKRKGFVYPNSEIYWGLANAWDFGPYGSLLKKNISDLWVKHFTQERDDVVFMDTAIIAHPTTWQASGHLASFSDALIDDKKTGKRFRADKLIEDYIEDIIVLELKKKWYNSSYSIINDARLLILQAHNLRKEKDPSYKRGKFSVDSTWLKLAKEIFREYGLIELEKKALTIDENQLDNEQSFKAKEQTDRIKIEKDLITERKIPNLSPESRGNEGMKAFIETHIPNNPETWNPAEWTECRNFNLMLGTNLGPVADESSKVYLRPETCQSLFTDFKSVLDSTRNRIPFGLAQIGKAFRNEITPGQFLYRTREFEQMEIEYFVPADPDKAMAIYNQWKDDCMHYWTKIIGINPENLRFKDHDKLAHYAAAAVDVEYAYPRGFGEIQGIHNRTNFDLTQHQEHSSKDMQYTDPFTGERYIPRCIEASFGLGRQVMVTMLEFYDEEQLEDWTSRVVIHFPKQLAPIKFAILPLIKKDTDQVQIAEDLFKKLSKICKCEYDDSGAIGKRYRRQDEIWTPYCITIDQQSKEDGTVTLRDRDTMEQIRVKIEDLPNYC